MTINRTVYGNGSVTLLLIAVFLSMAAGAEDITDKNVPSGAIDASKEVIVAPMYLKDVKNDKGAIIGPSMNTKLEAGGKGAIIGPSMNTKLEAGGNGAIVGPAMNSRVVPGDIDASESLKH